MDMIDVDDAVPEYSGAGDNGEPAGGVDGKGEVAPGD